MLALACIGPEALDFVMRSGGDGWSGREGDEVNGFADLVLFESCLFIRNKISQLTRSS